MAGIYLLRQAVIALSRSSEYAIRALTFLAQQPSSDRFHLVREMAEQLGIPAAFLGKVLQPLVTRGVLGSQRGKYGGFRLLRSPGELSLFEIVDSQERLAEHRACFLGQAECEDERACPMHEYWKAAHSAFRDRLAMTTLADLVRFCAERPRSGYPLRSVLALE